MTSTTRLEDTEQRAWRAFLRGQGRLIAALNRQLQEDSGLSLADYVVLRQLTDRPDGRVRPFELQRYLYWEQSRLSHQLTRMQRRGLVSREDCPDDARGALVVLTDHGRRAINAAAPGYVATVRRLFLDPLTPEQVATVEQVFSQVLDQLDQQP